MWSKFSVEATRSIYSSSGESMASIASVSTGKISPSSGRQEATIVGSSSESSVCSIFSMSHYVWQMVHHRWLMINGWW